MIEIFKKLMRLLDCFVVRSIGICNFENFFVYMLVNKYWFIFYRIYYY